MSSRALYQPCFLSKYIRFLTQSRPRSDSDRSSLIKICTLLAITSASFGGISVVYKQSIPFQEQFTLNIIGFSIFRTFMVLLHFNYQKAVTKFSSPNFQKMLSPNYIILKIQIVVDLEPPHQDLYCLQIQLFWTLVLKE